jgi:hypothetical protein
MTLAAAPSLSSLVRLKKLFNELNLDRVIDVPVYQDVLAWDVFRAGRFEPCLCALFLPSQVGYRSGVCDAEGCGLLADS